MNIFGSLGSNFSTRAAIRHTYRQIGNNDVQTLLSVLKTKFLGKPFLFYKGREAISAGLFALNLPRGSAVLITGFTCFVVYKAVTDAGLTPVLADISENDVNPTTETIKRVLMQNPAIRCIIAQNTFGFPVEINAWKNLAAARNIFVLEDLAHSVGSRYASGADAGRMGDLTALSFSRDKILDAVSGGALVIRNKEICFPEIDYAQISPGLRLKDRLYPLLTGCIRSTYPYGGKFFHAFLKKFRLLSTPMETGDKSLFHGFPPENAALAIAAIRANPGDILRRQKLANFYAGHIRKDRLISGIIARIPQSSCIRFPIRVPGRQAFLKELARKNIHLHDTWYDAPVAPKRFLIRTKYSGECPNAEALSETIVNLPTHREITEKKAQLLVKEINSWQT